MKFKRITKRTKFTFPCLLAYNWALNPRCPSYGWDAKVFTTQLDVNAWGADYTHWLPFQWPEGV